MLLDPATLTVAASGAVNGTFAFTVPNDPALQLVEVHWQAVRFDAGLTTVRLTNSIVSHIER